MQLCCGDEKGTATTMEALHREKLSIKAACDENRAHGRKTAEAARIAREARQDAEGDGFVYIPHTPLLENFEILAHPNTFVTAMP